VRGLHSGPVSSSSGAVKATGNGATSRADQLAELVRRQPGMTVREVAEQLGVKDPTGLYRPIRRLEDAGELRRSKGKLEPIN
jgi:DeoR/GlpR family transcriptional regulator of sugar metabolism